MILQCSETISFRKTRKKAKWNLQVPLLQDLCHAQLWFLTRVISNILASVVSGTWGTECFPTAFHKRSPRQEPVKNTMPVYVPVGPTSPALFSDLIQLGSDEQASTVRPDLTMWLRSLWSFSKLTIQSLAFFWRLHDLERTVE